MLRYSERVAENPVRPGIERKVVLHPLEEHPVERIEAHSPHPRLVKAPGVFSEAVAGTRTLSRKPVRPCSASSAGRTVLARAAFSRQGFAGAEGRKDLRLPPDIGKRRFPDVPEPQGEVGAGGDLSAWIYPAVADARDASPFSFGYGKPHPGCDPHVLRGACRADGEPFLRPQPEGSAYQGLVHLRGDVDDLLSPPRGDEEEELEVMHPEALPEIAIPSRSRWFCRVTVVCT